MLECNLSLNIHSLYNMFTVKRSPHNPILSPDPKNPDEAYAAYNPSPIKKGTLTHILYRAQTVPEKFEGTDYSCSRIMKASSKNGVHFTNRTNFIEPEESWERYGCEDPRITHINGKYYIFYTALSTFPFGPDGIKVGLAISKDLETIDAKYPITPFNAKAMTLFPEKINGKLTAILIANCDKPPSKVGIVQFEKESDMWSPAFWDKWYKNIDSHSITLKRKDNDRTEIGAAPIKTKYGWLLVYSHIQNYYTHAEKIFGIEAVLLDLEDPRKIVARTNGAMIIPETQYEKEGIVPNIIFPSGALVEEDTLRIFYGGADTVCATADVNIKHLLISMLKGTDAYITRSDQNPILEPTNEPWEKRAVFNPATIDLKGNVHILYRAMSEDNTSYCGYAVSKDGEHITHRSQNPAYMPREGFEEKRVQPSGNSGCEDPRITLINNTIYMCYTAYNGVEAPAVALTNISEKNFLNQMWDWSKPVLISPPGVDDKDACIVPIMKKGKHFFIHRINNQIVGSYIDLDMPDRMEPYVSIMGPRPGMWDSKKVGITTPPILTKKGWLLPYHAVSDEGFYRVGLALLDIKDPTKVIARSSNYIFEPVEHYEKVGQIPNVVFPCGNVVRKDTLYLYYGGADSVVGVATASIKTLLDILLP